MQNSGNCIPLVIYIVDFESECCKKWLLFQHSWAQLSIQQGMEEGRLNQDIKDKSYFSYFFLHLLENLKYDQPNSFSQDFLK